MISPQRRRADAERSRTAVLDAAVQLLGERPDAGMAAIATAAGVTRQTVYAHFSSRDDLLTAVVDRMTEKVAEAMDAASADEGPAPDALLRLLDAAWGAAETYPALVRLGARPAPPEEDRARHRPIADRIARVLQRGRDGGEFDPEPALSWQVAAVIALSHATGEEIRDGRMSATDATAALHSGLLRLLTPDPGKP
ncbi:TetR/AcrR family transcriptional regulator [Streptomyces flavofungini]|uniref:TetR/AcrR family transcriptional regulator n=1 Tax=Streptomyces flavofungini TaxID=68200 RepID=A0ABS0X7Z2_9ACTN|nr:TetR/AcrR family transcriptional regulator [Streptomyces flavofungini]MBJ3809327.1 TetR/AcrR family transcriptional regulator [Streptomyces flavofungini]GHC77608.1 TetR family transcriptional regulator [Streptomyces flavofungini]